MVKEFFWTSCNGNISKPRYHTLTLRFQMWIWLELKWKTLPLASPSYIRNPKETSPTEPRYAKLVKLGGCSGLEWTLCAAEIFGLNFKASTISHDLLPLAAAAACAETGPLELECIKEILGAGSECIDCICDVISCNAPLAQTNSTQTKYLLWTNISQSHSIGFKNLTFNILR